MPKEWTHWFVASEALKNAADDPAFLAALECPAAYFLGAIAHDSAYHRQGKKYIASRLHGKNNADHLSTVFAIAGNCPGSVPARAFACGVLTHVAVDAVFHPAVYYFTGSSTHPDKKIRSSYLFGHWAFETSLDRFLSRRFRLPFDPKVRKLLERIESHHWAADVYRAAAVFFGLKPEEAGEARNILLSHARLQDRLTSVFWMMISGLLALPFRGSNFDLRPAFYAYKPELDDFHSVSRDFLHPVTGEKGLYETEKFVSQAVDKSRVFVNLYHKSESGENPGVFPRDIPSLDTGLPEARRHPMIHMGRWP